MKTTKRKKMKESKYLVMFLLLKVCLLYVLIVPKNMILMKIYISIKRTKQQQQKRVQSVGKSLNIVGQISLQHLGGFKMLEKEWDKIEEEFISSLDEDNKSKKCNWER